MSVFVSLSAQPRSLGAAGRTFSNVVSQVALISRFRSRAQRRYVTFGQCFIEPVVRESKTHGKRYWSVLEEENSTFLDKNGYYGKGTRLKANLQPVPVKRSRWAAAKAAVSKSPCPVVDIQQTSPKKSQALLVAGTADGPKSPASAMPSPHPFPTLLATGTADCPKSPSSAPRSPRPSDVDASDDQQNSMNIPPRFMSRRSSCSFPLQPIVQPIPCQPVLQPLDEPAAKVPPRKIPTIEINNNEVDLVRRRHSELSKFQWYQSSSFSSSTSTEELGSPTSTDSYVRQLEQIRAARRASLPDVDGDRLFVRVSSDAASTVSSQTLIEANEAFESTGTEEGFQSKIAGDSVEHARQQLLPGEHLQQPDSFDIEEVGLYQALCHHVLPYCLQVPEVQVQVLI